MNHLNPVLRTRLEDDEFQMKLSTIRYRMRIEALYHWDKPIVDSLFDPIKNFCKRHTLHFILRPFNTLLEDDRLYVCKLPAFHIYYENEYEMTFYTDQSVENVFKEYVTTKTMIQSSMLKSSWSSWIQGLIPKRSSLSTRVVPISSSGPKPLQSLQ
jgi:RIO-like serine/threonine protein kinase